MLIAGPQLSLLESELDDFSKLMEGRGGLACSEVKVKQESPMHLLEDDFLQLEVLDIKVVDIKSVQNGFNLQAVSPPWVAELPRIQFYL